MVISILCDQVSLSLVYNQGESQHDMKLSLYGVCYCVSVTNIMSLGELLWFLFIVYCMYVLIEAW